MTRNGGASSREANAVKPEPEAEPATRPQLASPGQGLPWYHEWIGRRVLVHGVLGIEDSSRYWSAAMVVEHLLLVGEIMTEIVVRLSWDREPDVGVDIAAVKPPGRLPPEGAVEAYARFLADHRRRLAEDVGPHRKGRRWFHPWFGMLTVHHWHCLNVFHQRIHLRQLEAVARGSAG